MSFKDAKKHTTLCVVDVVGTKRISPNIIRVTVGGEQLQRLPDHGFDHWFRLFLPQESGETNFDVPHRADTIGYLKYLRMPAATRPHLRNYTVRAFRPADRELDIDFVVHGDEGVATRWVQRTAPGDTVALLDQGRGYDYPADTTYHLLAGDETALPAIAGILRDLPRDAVGLAVIEIPDPADAQPVDAPTGFEVRWLHREPGTRPGSVALAAVTAWTTDTPATVSAYLAGEQALPTTGRRHLVDIGVPKRRITFTGYWRIGTAH
ncbi:MULTISPECIES: siderophore-interacting protein [unclassified Solwaraspora]|uniref:siderophore-interacting protein n=1 Tax=unclassified Solwaraspora TaxID=2627926 RepID=UPI00259B638B|nr:siderophore-interacting protein [Solwaraspora sp. WMMA2056]WJK38755.1 siderophore-interacting protein [Solwaraspora sp. WMMA2056]